MGRTSAGWGLSRPGESGVRPSPFQEGDSGISRDGQEDGPSREHSPTVGLCALVHGTEPAGGAGGSALARRGARQGRRGPACITRHGERGSEHSHV